ncbi:cupredoxin domain-containing protein [Candidatus Acetothermia bacterium]|nr:cupredoxin domain-containing protein [Candidatus Acetothermia bacterium]MBI3459918.1 cupredoxin domain-containing protein [Candidatus Acetothermia bacterium]MBI3660233.1 cupredoxin domain-containing protein [Candidatus Acetothermia bacterium]
MSNIIAALLAIAATALLAVLILFSYRAIPPNNREGVSTQTPSFIVSEGKMTPKVINVSSQEMAEIIIINEGKHAHEIVLERVDANGKKIEELRRTPIEPGLSQNWTLRLVPGEYAIYCSLREGVHVHRKMGEEAKIIVK